MIINEEELELFYFHGSLPEPDAMKMLECDGDFLLCSKYIHGHIRTRLFLLVKTGGKYDYVEIERVTDGFRISKQFKYFSNVRTLVKYYYKNGITLSTGTIYLRRPIARSKYQLFHKDIIFQKKIKIIKFWIGRGAYGTVYKGILTRKGSNIPVAIKRVASEGRTHKSLTEMLREARVMQMFDHKNIVRLYGFIVSKAPYLLVMELCPDGSLEDKLRAEGQNVTMERRLSYSAQAACGIEYLHRKDCIHRDIATRNCLLNGKTLKVADFGMCQPTTQYRVNLSMPLNIRWLSPEVWKTGITNKMTDIFAFGITLWEMFIIPYETPYIKWKADEVKQQVIEGYRLSPPEGMPSKAVELMKSCWNENPTARPTAKLVRVQLEKILKGYTTVESIISSSTTPTFSQIGFPSSASTKNK